MTREEFDKICEEIKTGNDQGLDQIYLSYRESCLDRLREKLQHTRDRAEDYYMEAIWQLRKKILADKVTYQNLGGYIYTVAKNTMLNDYRKNQRIYGIANEETLEALDFAELESNGNGYEEKYDPLVLQEEKEAYRIEQQLKIKALQKAFDALGCKCQKLLKHYLLDGIALSELTDKLGYSNYNSIKASKYQCKKQLIKKFNEEYNKLIS